MCCSCLLSVAHCSLCVACVCSVLLTAHYLLLNVAHVCYVLLNACYVFVVHCSCLLNVAEYSLSVAQCCWLLVMCCSCLLTARYVLLCVAQCCLPLVMCCSCLLYVTHCSLCVAPVCYLLFSAYVLLMFLNCSLLIMCGISWCVVQCWLCVAHGCLCCSLPITYVCVPHVCSKMLYVVHCSLDFVYVYFMLLTAHYLSLMFAMLRSPLITSGFLVFAICCSLLMGCSYPLCGLQLNICCSYSVYQSQTHIYIPYIYIGFHAITALRYIYKIILSSKFGGKLGTVKLFNRVRDYSRNESWPASITGQQAHNFDYLYLLIRAWISTQQTRYPVVLWVAQLILQSKLNQ